MERVVTATDARIHFGELIRRVVEKKERVIVERSGKAQVVVLSMAEYERLMEKQDEPGGWEKLVDLARDQIRSEIGERKLMPPEEVIRMVREERDEQFMGVRRR